MGRFGPPLQGFGLYRADSQGVALGWDGTGLQPFVGREFLGMQVRSKLV